jgi:hypothetical protein
MDGDRLIVNESLACELRVNPDLLLAVGERRGSGARALRDGGGDWIAAAFSAAEVSI